MGVGHDLEDLALLQYATGLQIKQACFVLPSLSVIPDDSHELAWLHGLLQIQRTICHNVCREYLGNVGFVYL